ncbi:PorV/PorQ family protein [Phaeodactylibacter luteus]|uniref:Aromatic hydrocarbon degradation protein n=1 Tax=Phaeodactylibacter luteus TaxID=1564516 RepID=A0A5C6S0H8_9BACT|nr:hypothetical protein [Phaeodactylibacter luteus]TXB67904.1 hypothetical protein FRY97_03395 [Phaeodactylibacter luteus]
MMYRTLSLLLGLSLAAVVHGQNFSDALRFSSFSVGGTARSIGTGGALGALGSDFSVLSTNPAGLGWYRMSEFVISPGVYHANSSSVLLNDDGADAFEENRTNFNLNTFGVVFANANPNRDWRTINFGIGVNRLANYHQDFYYGGTSVGSIVNRFQEQANSEAGISDFESGLAIDVGALYESNPPDGLYYSDFGLAPDSAFFKSQDVFTRGAINELVFSLAGNFRERLLIGATVGVPIVRYEVEKEYREIDRGPGEEGSVPFFNALSYNEFLSTSGTGVNLKLGAIFRATQVLRLGLAVHTPTFMRLDDVYTASMGYNYTENEEEFEFISESPDGSFEYRLRTPWRLIGSAGFIISGGELKPVAPGSDTQVRVVRGGFLSAELEYLNYGNNRFQYDGFGDAEREVNATIQDELAEAWNLRLGGEYGFDQIRLRAGYSLQQSPLKGDDTLNSAISFGAGLRQKTFFADLAYRRQMNERFYTPYQTFDAPEQLVEQQVNLSEIVLTIGFRF